MLQKLKFKKDMAFKLPFCLIGTSGLFHQTFVGQPLGSLKSIVPPKPKLQCIKHFRMLPWGCGDHSLEELTQLAGHKETGALGNDDVKAFLTHEWPT